MQSVEDVFHSLACAQPLEQCEGVAVQRMVAGQGLRPLIEGLFEVLHADTVKKFYRVWQASKNKVVTYRAYCTGTNSPAWVLSEVAHQATDVVGQVRVSYR